MRWRWAFYMYCIGSELLSKLRMFFYEVKSIYLTLALTIGFALLMAFLAFKFYDHIVILTTALIGSYSFIRGLSIFIGKFPSEISMFTQIEDQEFRVEYYFWIYFSCILLFFVAGSIIQFKQRQTFNPDQYQKLK